MATIGFNKAIDDFYERLHSLTGPLIKINNIFKEWCQTENKIKRKRTNQRA